MQETCERLLSVEAAAEYSSTSSRLIRDSLQTGGSLRVTLVGDH
jgi:hypothetical protein